MEASVPLYEGAGIISAGRPLEFVSRPMKRNGKFKFELLSHVYKPHNRPAVDGDILYKVIEVNLQGL